MTCQPPTAENISTFSRIFKSQNVFNSASVEPGQTQIRLYLSCKTMSNGKEEENCCTSCYIHLKTFFNSILPSVLGFILPASVSICIVLSSSKSKPLRLCHNWKKRKLNTNFLFRTINKKFRMAKTEGGGMNDKSLSLLLCFSYYLSFSNWY